MTADDAITRAWELTDDPVDRYRALTAISQEYEQHIARVAALRARALAEAHVDGITYAAMADELGISRSRVQQLVEAGRNVTPADHL